MNLRAEFPASPFLKFRFLLPTVVIAAWLVFESFLPGLLLGVASIVTLFRLSPQRDKLSLKHLLGLLNWAVFLAFVTVFLRVVFGYVDLSPFAPGALASIPRWEFFFSLITPYDKREIYLILVELLVMMALLTVILAVNAQLLPQKRRSAIDWGLPVILAVGLLCTFALPPFEHNKVHWATWIGPALGVVQGKWPLFHTQLMYGLLNMASLGVFLKLFDFSSMTLSAWVMTLNYGTVIFAYYLMQKLTRSRWISVIAILILLTNFFDLRTALVVPNHGLHRWVLPSLLSLALFFDSIRAPHETWKSMARGAVVGLATLWEPGLGFMIGLAFVGIHVYVAVVGKQKKFLIAPASALITIGLVCLLIIIFGQGGWHAALNGILHGSRVHQSFASGYAAREQDFVFADVVLFGFIVLTLLLTVFRILNGRYRLPPAHLFLIFTCIVAVPAVAYCLITSAVEVREHYAWIIMPALTLVFSRSFRLSPRLPARFATVGCTALLVLPWLIGVANHATTGFSKTFLGAREGERRKFYQNCATATMRDNSCRPEAKPSLHKDVLAMIAPFPPDETIHVQGSDMTLLIEGCRHGIPILSWRDSWIFAIGHCNVPAPYASWILARTEDARQNEFDRIANSETMVLVDSIEIPENYLNALAPSDIEALKTRGFEVKEKCSNATILVKKDQPYDRSICSDNKVLASFAVRKNRSQ